MIKRMCNPSKSQSFFLFGPRGAGKTTFLKWFFIDTEPLWINLLDQKTEFNLAQNPDYLLDLWKKEKQKWIVIDEVQKIPRILDVVHQGIEEHKIKFALTGSSSRKLKRGGANLLAGRAASFSLAPFSSLELGDQFNLSKALKFGLLPKLWNEKLDSKDMSRSLYSYVQTYLKEEVAAEQLVRNLDPFRRVLVSAAQSNSKIINYAKIERDAGVAHSQAERHFEILCDTLVGRYLEPHDHSIRKRQIKKSKFYFFDTGVVRALRNLLEEDLDPGNFEFGDLFETFLINEFFKLNEALEKRWNFSYLRTKDDVEVDLIIEPPRGPMILIEIKSNKNIKPDDASAFLKISKEFPNARKYVLSNSQDEFEHQNIRFLNWQVGLKEIFAV
ncbi:MAG: AAA family ATPase [Bdellovibrionota bacterium]